ncbi:MAG: hypothetical protein Tsb0020_01330 [Haliangiales bacterium]
MRLPKVSRPVLNIPVPVAKETGLGSAIKTVTRKLGIEPCGGCNQRAAALDRWVGFKPISRGSK